MIGFDFLLLWRVVCVLVLLSRAVDSRRAMTERPAFTFSTKRQISNLRSIGSTAYADSRFADAHECYSAVMQLAEGVDGDEAHELRRRSGLTLAQVEIKRGNYKDAVARCSEVIEESTDACDLDELRALVKAHRRRARALCALRKSNLAVNDGDCADYYQSLIDADIAEPVSLQELSEDLLDFTDACQVACPRRVFTEQRIRQLSGEAPVTATESEPTGLAALFDTKQGKGTKQKWSAMLRSIAPLLGLSSKSLRWYCFALDSAQSVTTVTISVRQWLQKNLSQSLLLVTVVAGLLLFWQQVV